MNHNVCKNALKDSIRILRPINALNVKRNADHAQTVLNVLSV